MTPSCPHFHWLSKNFALPEERKPDVDRFLASEENGDTAILLDPFPTDWGNALVSLSPSDPVPPTVTPLVQITEKPTEFTQSTDTAPPRSHLQSWRFYRAEKEIAAWVASRLSSPFPPLLSLPSDPAITALFASSHPAQKEAALAAASLPFVILTGGPGTGKTYTLARALLLLLKNGTAPESICIAAPTGKATDRMKEAIAQAIETIPPSLRQAHGNALLQIAEKAKTLHSLLSYNPGSGKTFYHQQNPLPWQTIVIDECSMVDTLLWKTLLRAVAPQARLLLIGDPDQLESVGQGVVFGSLVHWAKTSEKLGSGFVQLTASHRFANSPDIQAIARALITNNARQAEQILRKAPADASRGLAWMENADTTFAHLPPPIQKALTAIAEAPDPRSALKATQAVCLLTAQRDHFVGAIATAEKIDAHFAKQTHLPAYNQPIIIGRNDPQTKLRNGSVGILHTDSSGVRKAYFPGKGNEKPQEFSVSQLPDYQIAWALTIHRSQGSEYDLVFVVLPIKESPLATRSLVYTAITRAKKCVFVAGSMDTIRKAVSFPSARKTLLPLYLP